MSRLLTLLILLILSANSIFGQSFYGNKFKILKLTDWEIYNKGKKEAFSRHMDSLILKSKASIQGSWTSEVLGVDWEGPDQSL